MGPASTDFCANAFAPIKSGAAWTYATTPSGGSPFSFSTTITDVRPGGFTASTKFDDNTTVDQAWACTPEGLQAMSIGTDQGPITLSAEGIDASLTTSNPSGITLPAKLEPGAKWTYGLDIAGTLSQGNQSAKLSGNVSTDMQAVGTESVAVPAGTFNAMKVQSTSTFKVTASYLGIGIPLTSTVNTTFWLVEGVGLVKASQTGELAGAVLDSTTELQSYKLP